MGRFFFFHIKHDVVSGYSICTINNGSFYTQYTKSRSMHDLWPSFSVLCLCVMIMLLLCALGPRYRSDLLFRSTVPAPVHHPKPGSHGCICFRKPYCLIQTFCSQTYLNFAVTCACASTKSTGSQQHKPS